MQNNSMSHSLYERMLIRCVLVIIGTVVIFFIIPKGIRILQPFVIALIVAMVLNPLVSQICTKTGVSRRVTALILDLLVFMVIFTLPGVFIYFVLKEAISLAVNIQSNWEYIINVLDKFENSFTWMNRHLPPEILDLISGFEENLFNFLQTVSKNVLNETVSFTSALTTKTGNFFLNFVVAILAVYFIIADYDIISAKFKYVEKLIGKHYSMLKKTALSAVGGYLKSQFLLALFAFLFTFVALIILRQPYALLIALFLGIIDFLPIVGTIAVLAPWGIIEIIGGDKNKGIYLLIVGIVFFLVRKVVEPKIVGSQTGLPPLAVLISSYAGLRLSGIWGAILGPIVLTIIVSIVKSGILDNTIQDVKLIAEEISNTLK